ncbi:hypothetical protein Daudx_1200 [Candidatus Desulforudis audaxviator]|nr:hypothetical protein Daudx_1200 [Candidatus Desulforudis audaxviator]
MDVVRLQDRKHNGNPDTPTAPNIAVDGQLFGQTRNPE